MLRGPGRSCQSTRPWPHSQAPAHPLAGAGGRHTLGLCPLGQKSTRKQPLCHWPRPPKSRKGSFGMRPNPQEVTGGSRAPGTPNSRSLPNSTWPSGAREGSLPRAAGRGHSEPTALGQHRGRASVPGPPKCLTDYCWVGVREKEPQGLTHDGKGTSMEGTPHALSLGVAQRAGGLGDG